MVGLASRQPISPRVRAEIERILRKNLSRYGFVRAGVEPGDDHDGDPAIFIDAEYVLSDDPVDVNTVIRPGHCCATDCRLSVKSHIRIFVIILPRTKKYSETTDG